MNDRGPDIPTPERASRDAWQQYDDARRLYELTEAGNRFYDRGRYREALEAYLSAADKAASVVENRSQDARGLAQLFLRIGSMYFRGLGAVIDPKRAEHWITKGASFKLPVALYSLAVIRSNQDRYDEARALLEDAAARGYTPAVYRLGVLYDIGVSVPRDVSRAKELYEDAALHGHLLAQRQCAIALLKGERGAMGIVSGAFQFATGLIRLLWLQLRDPTDERIQV